jgi:uncharacterized protein YndB with AHSA1/START domain
MNVSRNLPVCFLFLLLTGTTAGADGETRSVNTEVFISASPEDVLHAFVDDDDLRAWWKVSRTLVEPEAGGVWSISWDDWGEEKTQHSWSGVIEVLSPNRLVIDRLVMNEPNMPLLGPMRLEIRVKPVAGGTLLSLSHSGYRYGDHWDKMYELVVQGWDHVLGDMEAWILEEY